MKYQVMLLQDTIGKHLLEVDKAAREREKVILKQLEEKEPLPDNQKEVEKLLEQYILRFERDPAVSLIQHIVGITNMSSISLQVYEKKGQDAIHMAMTGLKNLYEQGKFTEQHSIFIMRTFGEK